MHAASTSRSSGAEWRIDLSGDGFVREHRVGGAAVMPGVAYLDFVARAAHAEFGVTPVEIEQVAVVAPLRLRAGEEITLSVTLARGRGDRVWFEVASGSGDSDRLEHASGSMRLAGADAQASPIDIAALARRCSATIGRDRLYSRQERLPIQYGPYFQSVEWVRTDGVEIFASVALPDAARADAGHLLHPALVDGALQALAAVMEPESGGALYVPFAFGSVRPLATPPSRTLVHGRCRNAPGDGDAEFLRGDLRLCDEDGRILVALDDVALKRVPPGRPMTEARTPIETQGTIEEGREA